MSMKLHVLCGLFCFSFFSLQCFSIDEFLYPVGAIEQYGNQKVFLLYQKSTYHIELWTWDPQTKIVSKALLSSFTPAGFKLLPNKKGFSFIDNGRIRVKTCEKRSPKSIDLYEPIYDVSSIEWINPDCFYLGAKKRNRSGIFQVHTLGIIDCIAYSPHYDCLYPQKVDDQLFYIERGQDLGGALHFTVVSAHYPEITYDITDNFNNSDNFDERVDQIMKQEDMFNIKKCIEPVHKEVIVDLSRKPIAFLKMISQDLGFFIGYPETVDRSDKAVTFSCHRLEKKGSRWRTERLFHFSIPSYLLFDSSDSRLYESILPLLPRYHHDMIYFVDSAEAENYMNLHVFQYNLKDGVILQKSNARANDALFFSPLIVNNKLFYGGNLSHDPSRLPAMWINEDGLVCFDLPFASI